MSIFGIPPTESGSGFLKFNSLPPRLHIAGDDPEFDPVTIKNWQLEGFDVTYLPLQPGPSGESLFIEDLLHLSDDLELGEAYALIAYGHAASLALQVHQKPQHHLAALVAYYPDVIKHPQVKYPPHLQVVCHLAGNQPFSPSFKSYRYSGTLEGFAEEDLDEFEPVAAGLAWGRSLECVRRGFKRELGDGTEGVREGCLAAQYVTHDTSQFLSHTTSSTATEPSITHIPTLTGGIGRRDLTRFYRDFFMSSPLPSLGFKLISRTMSVDHVVDEMYMSFRHTREIPWLLPGIPPTDKPVEFILISIVTMRGGKLVNEHLYWDQASVLVQVGLLDPKLVPEGFREKGVKKLPVVGREGARKVLDKQAVPSNGLIPGWSAGAGGQGQKALPVRNGGPKGHGQGQKQNNQGQNQGQGHRQPQGLAERPAPAQLHGHPQEQNRGQSKAPSSPVQNAKKAPGNKGKTPVSKSEPLVGSPVTPTRGRPKQQKGQAAHVENGQVDNGVV